MNPFVSISRYAASFLNISKSLQCSLLLIEPEKYSASASSSALNDDERRSLNPSFFRGLMKVRGPDKVVPSEYSVTP
jgi:hypothetical protein